MTFTKMLHRARLSATTVTSEADRIIHDQTERKELAWSEVQELLVTSIGRTVVITGTTTKLEFGGIGTGNWQLLRHHLHVVPAQLARVHVNHEHHPDCSDIWVKLPSGEHYGLCINDVTSLEPKAT
jgi:hypothetical protein